MRALSVALVLVLLGATAHAGDQVATAFDAITTPGKTVPVRMKLTHAGLLGTKVSKEPVTFRVFGATKSATTDGTGFASVDVTPSSKGVVEFSVWRDRATTTIDFARIFVLETTRPVAVVDVDGTLSDMAELSVPLSGDLAETFSGAPELLKDVAKKYAIVYLTARDDRFDQGTRSFLARHGFPDGPVIYNDIGFASAAQLGQLIPANHGKFKLAQIKALKARGVDVQVGIGNAETDAYAYENANLKSYILTSKKGTGPSFRYTDYAVARQQMEKDGVLDPLPAGTIKAGSQGIWRFAFVESGAASSGSLDIELSGSSLVATVREDGGATWTGATTIANGVITIRRGQVEYVATLHGDDASVAIFSLGATRTLVGSGSLARPPYFNAKRHEVVVAISEGDDAICALDDKALAVASTDEKVAMIEILLNWGKAHSPASQGLNFIPIGGTKQSTVVRILKTAQDAAAFDRVFGRLDAERLFAALTFGKDKEARDLVKKWRGTVKPGDWTGYLSYLDGVTGSESSGKNDIDFLIDAAFLPALKSEIVNALESIHVEIYQWEANDVGWEVARALVFKAQQGVKVRMLLDGSGSEAGDAKAKVLFDFIRQGGVQLIVNPAGLTRAHLDHRKIFVMDGLVGFTGGMNIGNSFQRDWHDQQTRLRGPIVAKLQKAFLTRWMEEGGTPPSTFERPFPKLSETPKGAVARAVAHDGAGVDRNIKAAYLRAIGTAQKTIKIANPYFSDEDVIGALCSAAKRKVNVQVVLPKENDVGIMKSTAAAYYNQLIESGVEVYEYEPRMAHEKVAIIDGLWCTAGSSNLDARSLEFNDELNWISLDSGVAQVIQKTLFDVDLAHSQRMKKRTGFFSWFDGLFRSVAVWL